MRNYLLNFMAHALLFSGVTASAQDHLGELSSKRIQEIAGTWKQLDSQTILIAFGQSKLRAKIYASGDFTLKPETITELGVTFTRIGLVFNQPCEKAAKVSIAFTPQ
jgi:hypothetical protein